MARVARTLRALLATCAAGACVPTTAPSSHAGASLLGEWRYTATQTAPADARLDGTFVVREQTGDRMAGTLDAVEDDARGLQRARRGALAGRADASGAVDFDVQLDGAVRRHVGRLAGDSLAGSWVDVPREGGGAVGAGRWAAGRTGVER